MNGASGSSGEASGRPGGSIEAINAPAGGGGQMEIQVDDTGAATLYSTTSRVWGSAEEIYLDFGGNLRPAGPSRAVLKVEQRVILSPWAAKRLAIALSQVVANYERLYGTLELDQRKRLVSPPSGAPSSPRAPGGSGGDGAGKAQ